LSTNGIKFVTVILQTVSNKKTEALEQASAIEGILCGKWVPLIEQM